MPNWCSNSFTFSHEDSVAIVKLAKAFSNNNVCMTFLPVGRAENYDNGWGQVLLQTNIWGTKWDFGLDCNKSNERVPFELDSVAINKTFTCQFETAWKPPIKVFDELVRLGYKVDGMYLDEGNFFGGYYSNGINDVFEYPGELYLNGILGEEYIETFNLEQEYESYSDPEYYEQNDNKGMSNNMETANIKNNTVRIFPSFSGLVRLVQAGYKVENDDSNCLYFFGCTKQGLEETFALYEATAEDKEKLVSMLETAELDGRVSFRDNTNPQDEYIRFVWLMNALKICGQPLDELDLKLLNQEINIVNNIRALEHWVFNTFINVEVTTQASIKSLNLLKK